MDVTGGPATALVMTQAGTTQPMGQAVLGPALTADMGEPALVAALNAWGGAMHGEVLALRADLGSTQAAVAGAFAQAEVTVLGIVTDFRAEVAAMRQTTLHEAGASLARLQAVVAEARTRFGEQDARFTAGLGELAQRLQAADTWAQGEPVRVAAIVNAAPVPEWLRAVRGSPPPVPSTPLRAEQPQQPQQPQPQPQHAAADDAGRMAPSPAWAAWAANRGGPDPAAGAWAQAPRLPEPRQHYNIASPPGFGGAGGGGGKGDGRGGYPKELRINARDWNDSRKLDVTPPSSTSRCGRTAQ